MSRVLTQEETSKRDARRAKFREIAKKLAKMSDGERSALAAKMIGLATCEGHMLSPHNVCMIAFQMPTATLVGGFRQWLKQGRCVKKGEHSLMIWCASARKSDEAAGEAAPDDVRFIMGSVFDVSQTEETDPERWDGQS